MSLKWYRVAYFYTPRNEVVGVYTGFTMSVRPSVDKSYVVRSLELCFLESFKIVSAVYWWRQEDLFHFWRFSLLPFQSYWTWYDGKQVILCRMITWVEFLRMFWNFISCLPVKRGGYLSFLTVFTFAIPELLHLIWRKIGYFALYVVQQLE